MKQTIHSICLAITFTSRVLAVKTTSTAWKVSKYRVISGQYFPVFGLNTGKYVPEITSYLGTFYAV